ncbi:hypothetical protein [Cellulomonas endometrii]|uniref:hypothetical protein n=1 Tax=Cellulomonas endometrii TaxID=3036301 RepID=UPI0024AE6B4A|nr:hypothetical protein [Cellulomonas endometrii]
MRDDSGPGQPGSWWVAVTVLAFGVLALWLVLCTVESDERRARGDVEMCGTGSSVADASRDRNRRQGA